MEYDCAIFIVVGKKGHLDPYPVCWYESLPDAQRMVDGLQEELGRLDHWYRHMCANNPMDKWEDLLEEYTEKMTDISARPLIRQSYDIWHVPQIPIQVIK
jgi:hypothetical protein